MRSWTRTLNLDDAHTLLALAQAGTPLLVWHRACHDALSHLSTARCRELIRIVREDFLEVQDHCIQPTLFTRHYETANPVEQVELVHVQWALTHPLTLEAAEHLVHPALEAGSPQIHLEQFTRFVDGRLGTASRASRTKTRTVLVGALEGVGCLGTQGTGRYRTLWARRGAPTPATVAFLTERGGPELVSLLTACSPG